MTDEQRHAPDVIASGFQSLVEGLRDDVREDIRDLRVEVGASEKRVTARVAVVEEGQKQAREFIETFAVDHGKSHEAEAKDRRKAHGEFYEFIRQFELDEARRAGALGVIRFGFELVSKHATRIIAVILALAAAAGVATGNIELAVGR